MDRINDFFRQHPRAAVALAIVWFPALAAGLFWLRHNGGEVVLVIIAAAVVVHLGISLLRHAAKFYAIIAGGLDGFRHAVASTVSCCLK